jgi:hypothetical protein
MYLQFKYPKENEEHGYRAHRYVCGFEDVQNNAIPLCNRFVASEKVNRCLGFRTVSFCRVQRIVASTVHEAICRTWWYAVMDAALLMQEDGRSDAARGLEPDRLAAIKFRSQNIEFKGPSSPRRLECQGATNLFNWHCYFKSMACCSSPSSLFVPCALITLLLAPALLRRRLASWTSHLAVNVKYYQVPVLIDKMEITVSRGDFRSSGHLGTLSISVVPALGVRPKLLHAWGLRRLTNKYVI